mmetsp:Transcript_20366/g.51432  ORF Transcript_20366/g.51432 Transcript_20366/m.51432 type:complete len:265 (-) Transcript_20366:76-870(-)
MVFALRLHVVTPLAVEADAKHVGDLVHGHARDVFVRAPAEVERTAKPDVAVRAGAGRPTVDVEVGNHETVEGSVLVVVFAGVLHASDDLRFLDARPRFVALREHESAPSRLGPVRLSRLVFRNRLVDPVNVILVAPVANRNTDRVLRRASALVPLPKILRSTGGTEQHFTRQHALANVAVTKTDFTGPLLGIHAQNDAREPGIVLACAEVRKLRDDLIAHLQLVFSHVAGGVSVAGHTNLKQNRNYHYPPENRFLLYLYIEFMV